MTSVKLSSIIASVFWPVWRSIKSHEFTHYWFKGGRNSTKSSFISIAIVLLIMANPDANAVVFRKVGNTLADSVYEQIMWACDMLHVSHLFNFGKSPMNITYLPTGQVIRFRGCDRPERRKSPKFKRGYCAIVWFEEVAEFGSMAEIRSILASFLRGGSLFWVFYSYNPPMSARNWVNKEARDIEAHPGEDGRFICHTTYLDVIGEHPEWISEQARIEAERSRRKTPDAYRWEWLGEVIGTGAEVFPDSLIEIRRITEEERASFGAVSHGVDAGSVHPWVHECVAYDENERILYVFGEDVRRGIEAHDSRTAKVLIDRLDAMGEPDADVWCDSAARGMILYYQDQGINARKAFKQGLNSPASRVRWMQNLAKIVIDPDDAPLAALEFPEYEYVANAQGDITETLPKVDDDAIDAVGYGSGVWIRSNL